MVSDSDIHLSKLDDVLEEYAIETSNDFKSKTFNYQSSQTETNVSSYSLVVTLRDGKELTIRDPLALVATKGMPNSASRIESASEDSLSQKEVKHRKCENYQLLGHYRTSCPLLV